MKQRKQVLKKYYQTVQQECIGQHLQFKWTIFLTTFRRNLDYVEAILRCKENGFRRNVAT